eukprot:jgi/Chrzof1/971/Cz01g35090.t1
MRYAVIGGGVAGVCCVEELCQSVQPADEALFVSASTVLKGAKTVLKVTNRIEEVQSKTGCIAMLMHKSGKLACIHCQHCQHCHIVQFQGD